ncbi:MAG: ISNCY family transposase [Terriglobia bacterium]
MGGKVGRLPTLLGYLDAAVATFPDPRTGSNTKYALRDAALGAFSVFFTQSPSFLAHQQAMERSKGRSNAGNIFGLKQIPTDNHIRSLLDPAPASRLAPVFRGVFDSLVEQGTIDEYRIFDGTLTVPLDGTWFHNSKTIHCPACSHKEHQDGSMTWFHNAITPVIVNPGRNRVLNLEPEFITPRDGAEKQDCENAAAKRWLTGAGRHYAAHRLTILGDDLYCNQPMCTLMKENGYDFLLTCKYTSHKYLADWIGDCDPKEDLDEHWEKHWDGKGRLTRRYRYANGVPIKDGEGALRINWMELAVFDKEGKRTARHVFATTHHLTRANVAAYVQAGRARWKIENEHNNTLKTKGYNLEHNFGHGNENLSNLLLSFNLLAFLFHTVLDLFDPRYRLVRETLPRRDRFFHDLKALTQYLLFDSWDALMLFMLEGLDLEDPGG